LRRDQQERPQRPTWTIRRQPERRASGKGPPLLWRVRTFPKWTRSRVHRPYKCALGRCGAGLSKAPSPCLEDSFESRDRRAAPLDARGDSSLVAVAEDLLFSLSWAIPWSAG